MQKKPDSFIQIKFTCNLMLSFFKINTKILYV